MKRSIAFLLIFSLLIFSGNLYAKKKGAELEIVKKDGRKIMGELITVKQNSLLLKDSQSEADVSVDIEDIKVIVIVKKSKALVGAVPGFLIGVGVVIYTYAEGTQGEGMGTDEWAAFHFITIGVPAILLGVLIGGLIGLDKKIQFEGKSDAEIKRILEELRKKARVTNFQ